MRYDYQLIILESKGINYHRKFSDYILSKINLESQFSFLVNGDINLLVSYLLSKKLQKIHVQNFGIEEPSLPCLIDETDNKFDLKEYDVIISIFPKFKDLQRFIKVNTNVIIFLPYETSFIEVEKYLDDNKDFSYIKLEGYYVLSNF